MKNIYLFVGLCLLSLVMSLATLRAQNQGNMPPLLGYSDTASLFRLPVGFARIGDQNYVGLRVNPEIVLGKLGFGVDLPLFFNLSDGSFRNEEYKNGTGWFRLLSHVRWGVKERDRFFFRLGALNFTYLGFGYLMNNYNNIASFERRKVGLTFKIQPGDIWGVEGTYSDFNGASNLWAVRPYLRPLAKTELPILETLELGVGFVTDHDKNLYGANGERIDTRFVRDGANGLVADIGLSLIQSSIVNLRTYAQYARLGKNDALAQAARDTVLKYDFSAQPLAADDPLRSYGAGQGFNIGASLNLNILADVLNLDIRLERLWQSAHFMPQFFDAVYELDKDAKLWTLANTREVSGTYGRVSAQVLKKLMVVGGLQIPDRVTDATPALVHLGLNANDLIPKVTIQGSYVKGRIGNLADAFTLDDRSQATIRVGYEVFRNVVAGVDYRWTFARYDDNGITKFRPTSYVMPYFGLNIPLGRQQ